MTSLVNSIKYFKNVYQSYITFGFSSGTVVKKKKKNLPADTGDAGLIPRSRRSPGNGTASPTHSSVLSWQATGHGVA